MINENNKWEWGNDAINKSIPRNLIFKIQL